MRIFICLILFLIATTATAGRMNGAVATGMRIGSAVIAPPQVGGCTYGDNCYCDTVVDGALLFCEDFENPNYYSTTDWVSGTGSGSTFDRGAAADWADQFSGGADYLSRFTSSDPSPPRVGSACGSSVVECKGPREFCSETQGNLVDSGGADCWEVNATSVMDIFGEGESTLVDAGFTLSNGPGVASDIGGGNRSFAYIIRNGAIGGVGVGRATWSAVTEVGITQAHAYSTNAWTSNAASTSWKHEEWSTSGSSYAENWNLGNTGHPNNSKDYAPYGPQLFTTSVSACKAAFSGVTAHVGGVACNDLAAQLLYTPATDAFPGWNSTDTYANGTNSGYNRGTDFPAGEWHCTRAHITGMGTTNLSVKIWHDDTLVVHFSGFDGTALENQSYTNMWMNAYNNQAVSGNLNVAAVARYRDNIHIRQGEPVSCASIGF